MLTMTIKGHKFTADTVGDLRTQFETWRDANGFGASDIGGQWPVKSGGVKVGALSYNGRFSEAK